MATKPKTEAAQASALYKSFFDCALDANRAMVSGMERGWREQIEAFEGAMDRIKPLGEAKQPADLLSAQIALATDLNQQAMSTASSLLEIQRETGAQLRSIADESVKALSAALPRAA